MLGELVNEVATDPHKLTFLEVMEILEKSIKRRALVTFGLGAPRTKVLEIAAALRKKDYKLEVTDSLIVACAFEDPECQVLYTFDTEILQSSTVREQARETKKKVRPVE